jgi:hexosaminidase
MFNKPCLRYSLYVVNVNQVVISHATHLYFDFPIEPDPEERGLYWATRTTPIKKAFSYKPDSIYDNMEIDVNGNPLNITAICLNDGCPALIAPGNIIGEMFLSHWNFFCFTERMNPALD